MINVAITTTDNPFNPFLQPTEWQAYDEFMGYYTMSYLARVACTSPDLSPDDYALAVEEAIDSIVELNLTGNYKKVFRDVEATIDEPIEDDKEEEPDKRIDLEEEADS